MAHGKLGRGARRRKALSLLKPVPKNGPDESSAPRTSPADPRRLPQDAAALATVMATRGGTRSDWAPAAQRLLDNALVLLVAELTCPERPPGRGMPRRWPKPIADGGPRGRDSRRPETFTAWTIPVMHYRSSCNEKSAKSLRNQAELRQHQVQRWGGHSMRSARLFIARDLRDLRMTFTVRYSIR